MPQREVLEGVRAEDQEPIVTRVLVGERVKCIRREAQAGAILFDRLDFEAMFLARELCASATLYRVGGRAPTALRSLQLAFTMLSGRAGTFEPAAVRD